MTSWVSPLGLGLLASGGRGFLRKSAEKGGVVFVTENRRLPGGGKSE